MIHLTESAVNAVRSAISGAGAPLEGLRIAVDAGGCAGFKYMMGLVAVPEPDDAVVESDGVKVFVDRAKPAAARGHHGRFRDRPAEFGIHLRQSAGQVELLLRQVFRLRRRTCWISRNNLKRRRRSFSRRRRRTKGSGSSQRRLTNCARACSATAAIAISCASRAIWLRCACRAPAWAASSPSSRCTASRRS